MLAEGGNWRDRSWRKREQVSLGRARGIVRVPLPKGAEAGAIRCVLEPGGRVLEHWLQTVEMVGPRVVCQHGETHYRFPRLCRLSDGRLLLVYRIGATHATDPGGIAMRTSNNGGDTWSDERVIHRDPQGYSAQNVVQALCRDGRIILFIGRYNFRDKPPLRLDQYWIHSDDGGETWSAPEIFDADPSRNDYYMTEAIQTSDGLLGCSSTFVPPGVEPCYNVIWHSGDDGRTWRVRSQLTSPDENKGDEVAMIETDPGKVMLILRGRKVADTYRCFSEDLGRTWAARESIKDMVGVLQRPLLTRLAEDVILLTGRNPNGHKKGAKHVVCYLSRDNGMTFGERHVMEVYNVDGAYTGAIALSETEAIVVYYSDQAEAEKPDLKQVKLQLLDAPRRVCIHLPEDVPAGARVFLYYDNPDARSAEDRSRAFLSE